MLTTDHAQSLAPKAKLFRNFADTSRLAILEALRPGARSVSELVEATGLSQPNVSNHLACLLGCGLVSREQRGRHAFYAISDPRVDELLGWAEALLDEVPRIGEGCARCAVPERA
ncbi:hypothetical protein BH20GEM3_BH20GEM3_02610 [soil metagenome]|jgi:DNA-binding transcriptional ArsR family regulator|nr:metalloregulator ArsR/SmtB family transcription factor [Gemmatimonadota bacterium]